MSEASEHPSDDGVADSSTGSGDGPGAEGDAGVAAGSGGDRPGVNNFVRALEVRTQAKRGFVVGLLVAVATYWFFVVASGGSPYSTPYLLALAGVLAFTTGLLATLAFALHAAYRLSQRLE